MSSAARPLLADATARLARAGVESARVDAELLLAHALGTSRSRLVTVDDVPARVGAEYETMLRQREARLPLQHITGTAPFRAIDVAVGPGVFVPRPETELLVDAVLPVLATSTQPFAVDLCSGSGALALAIADEVSGARVIAVERAGEAADWLARNTATSRIEVLIGELADDDLLAAERGAVDAVVCNPPYVPSAAEVAPEVRHDPEVAVFAGVDGLALIPHAIHRAAELLKPGGVLALEHDDTHEHAVPKLLAEDGRWEMVADHRDLAGRPRYATARRC